MTQNNIKALANL